MFAKPDFKPGFETYSNPDYGNKKEIFTLIN